MVGRAQLNIGAVDVPGAFINFMKGYGSQSFPGTDPSNLDANGYPITTLAGNIGGSIALPSGFAGNGVNWIIKNTGTRSVRLTINIAVTKSSSTGLVSTTGGSNSAMVVTFTGAGSVTFAFNDYASSSVSFFFPSGFANVAGTGEIALVRQTDEAAYDAGTYFTPEFIALLQDLNPKTIRPMGWVNVGGNNLTNEVKWGYRATTSSLSWVNRQFPPGAWGGTVGGTDTYTMSAATDTPGSWTDGEVIQGLVTNANTSTTPTLNVNSRGAKTIVNTSAAALSAGSIAAGSLATFIYDGLLDRVIFASAGITASVPIEAQVQLANTLGMNLWGVLPNMADDTYVSSWATYARDNLDSALTFYAEYGNEIWNFSFPQTHWAVARGAALGFDSGNNRQQYGWYGLRTRQIMGAITTLWSNVGKTNLKRVLAIQAFGPEAGTQLYRLNGADLVGATYPNYLTYVGGVDPGYSVEGSRPIDYADVISPAHYYSGANFTQGTYVLANATFLQTVADLYATGDAADLETALASLDADIRTTVATQTLAGLNATIYPRWEGVAEDYTGKTVEPYEAGLECLAPTEAQCSSPLGISVDGSAANASAALTSLLAAYKNSGRYQSIVAYQFEQFLAQPHSANPSWLTITGPNQWGLLSGDLFSTPYQTYYAFKNYNNSKRRWAVKTS